MYEIEAVVASSDKVMVDALISQLFIEPGIETLVADTDTAQHTNTKIIYTNRFIRLKNFKVSVF